MMLPFAKGGIVQATPTEIQSLLAAQQADFNIMHMTRDLEELPQRQIILECRTKRAALEDKAAKIGSLKKESAKKRTRVQDEDASLEKKEKGVQAAIEAAGGDYRNVEARTKELDGIFRRRQVLAEEMAQIDAEHAKILALEEQVVGALDALDATEAQATDEFKREGGRLKTGISQASTERDQLLDAISAELADAYRDTSERMGCVVVGKLEGSRCGVCRAGIDPGRLIELRSQAPVAFCPICKRLLILEG